MGPEGLEGKGGVSLCLLHLSVALAANLWYFLGYSTESQARMSKRP